MNYMSYVRGVIEARLKQFFYDFSIEYLGEYKPTVYEKRF
jgi:hypothetical protein